MKNQKNKIIASFSFILAATAIAYTFFLSSEKEELAQNVQEKEIVPHNQIAQSAPAPETPAMHAEEPINVPVITEAQTQPIENSSMAEPTNSEALPSRSIASEETTLEPAKKLATEAHYPQPISKEEAPIPEVSTPKMEENPTVKRTLASEMKPWSEFTLSPVLYFSSIKSTDKSTNVSANFYSKQNMGVDGQWIQHHNPSFSTMLGISIRSETWDESLTTGKSFAKKSYMANSFLLGGAFHSDETLTFSSAFKMGQESYRRSTKAGTEITFDTPTVSTVSLGVKKYFNTDGHYHIGLDLKAFSILPKSLTNYSVKASPGGLIGLSIREVNQRSSIEAQVYYEYKKINTSILKEVETSVGVALIYSFGSNPNRISP